MAMADVDRVGHAAYRFVSDGTSAPNLTRQMVPASLSPDVKALHVGTLGLVFEPMATTVAGLVEREHRNRPVMVDPNIRPSDVPDRSRLDRIMAQSTIVKASDDDVTWLYPGLDLEAAARTLLARGPRLVVVTMSDHDQLHRDLHLDRDELHAALEFACLVASITCTRAGADPPRRAELNHPQRSK
jgi:fructokinase